MQPPHWKALRSIDLDVDCMLQPAACSAGMLSCDDSGHLLYELLSSRAAGATHTGT